MEPRSSFKIILSIELYEIQKEFQRILHEVKVSFPLEIAVVR